MGKYDNIGAKVGFIVCSDVPVIAYGLSGYSFQHVLKEDFKKHKESYNTQNGNTPANPYFHRRARNLYAYFKANGKTIPPDATPTPGDLAFYSKQKSNYISHVALVTGVTKDGYTIFESAPKTFFAQEVAGTSPVERGWKLVGFGSM